MRTQKRLPTSESISPRIFALLISLGICSLVCDQAANATLLTYKDKYVVSSSTAATTASISLTDDTEASQTFSLTANQTVLVIYSAHNANGATETVQGKQIAVSVDGADHANTWASPNNANYPNGATTFWIGSLGSGSHTIKGRVASKDGTTVTISERVLLVYILDGDAFYYTDDSTVQTTTSGTFIDDPNAAQTFTPSVTCKALMLYNVGSGTEGTAVGKKIAISLEGVDYSQADTAAGGGGAGYGDDAFTFHYAPLSATSYTAKGRFASTVGGGGYTAHITRRQLGILLFDDSTLADYVTSDTQVSTTSNYPVDDTQATISRTTSDTRELLVMSMGTKRQGTASSIFGNAYGIKVNANDRAKSRSSANGSNNPINESTTWGETLTADSHTVQGRFGNNTATEIAMIDSRRVVALWLSTTGGGPVTNAPVIDNTGGATSITDTGATLNGNLTSTGGAPTEVRVYWGTSDGGTAFGSWDNTASLGELAEGAVSQPVSGLNPSTTYYYRFYATNSAGEAWAGSAASFATAATPTAPVIDNTGGATSITDTGATLNGNLTSTGGAPTEVRVYWGTTDGGTTFGSWDNTASLGELAEGAASQPVSGLNPSTTYYYRFYATNSAGEAWAGSAASFDTLASPPPPTAPVIDNTGGATSITDAGATLNGNLTSTGGAPTEVRVYWGTTDGGTTFGSWDNTASLGELAEGAVSQPVSGLNPSTTYYYRFYATNSAGEAWAGSAASFDTIASPPAPTAPVIDNTGGATSITDTGATLNGNLTSTGGAPTEVRVYWGTTDGGTTFGSWDNTASLGELAEGAVSQPVSGLNPSTTYYYRFYATNSAGEAWAGSAASFDTIAGPPAPTAPVIDNTGGATSITDTGATLNGNLTSTGGAPTEVRVYWGTSDAGATLDSWDHNASLGELADGAVSQPVSGLNPSTTYYYRFYALNSAGEALADPASSFDTPATPPVVTAPLIGNSGVSKVKDTSAALNGNLTSTGGAPTEVRIYWGASDGGTTFGAWDNTASLGELAEGAASQDVTGLNPSATYYYSFYATNSAGEAWGSPVSSFMTSFHIIAITNDANGATVYWESIPIWNYSVYKSTNLLEGWPNPALVTDQPGDAGGVSAFLDGSAVESPAFYKVKANTP